MEITETAEVFELMKDCIIAFLTSMSVLFAPDNMWLLWGAGIVLTLRLGIVLYDIFRRIKLYYRKRKTQK